MNRFAPTSALASALVVVLSTAGCGGSSPASPSTSSSGPTTTTTTTTTTGTTLATSHNAGRDCLSCHSFAIAGTAYKSDGVTVYPGATIKLTTEAAGGGSLVASLTADGSGNFYTGNTVNLGAGVYATATGTSGTATAMSAAVTSRACNSCHTTGRRIYVQ
jgi:hypothetical protein